MHVVVQISTCQIVALIVQHFTVTSTIVEHNVWVHYSPFPICTEMNETETNFHAAPHNTVYI